MDAYRANGWDGLTPEAQSAINQLKNINTDWNDILFRDAFTQEYNFSISGGSENVTYYNSLGYSKEDGNVPGVSMKRFNLTSKTSYQINRMLKIGMSLFANRRKNTDFVADKYGYANPIYYSRTANPYFNPYDSNGNSLLSRFWLVHLPSFLERLLLTAVRCYGKTVIRTICEIMLLI